MRTFAAIHVFPVRREVKPKFHASVGVDPDAQTLGRKKGNPPAVNGRKMVQKKLMAVDA